MATLKELQDAFVAADKAGNVDDARAFAAEIRKMRATGGVQAAPTAAPQSARERYDALPEWQKPLVAFSDVARIASNALTNNRRDRYAQFLGGGTPEEEAQKTAEAWERAGSAGTGAAMLPAFALPGLKASAAIPMAAAVGMDRANVESEGQPLDERLAKMGQGGIQGTIDGILGQVVGKAIGGAFEKFGNVIDPPAPRLSATQLAREKELANFDVENSGIRYRPGTIQEMIKAIDKATEGRRPRSHRKTVDVVNYIEKEFGGKGKKPEVAKKDTARGRSLYDLDELQKMVTRDVSKTSDEGDAYFGPKINKAIDDTLNNVELKGILTGKSTDPQAGFDMVQRARTANRLSKKIDKIERQEEMAERRSESQTQLTSTQAKQNRINSILDSESEIANYTPDEIDEMQKLARGTPKIKALKKTGELLVPGTSGSPAPYMAMGGAGSLVGYLTGNPAMGVLAGGVPPAIGMIAKKWADRATDKGFEELKDLIAAGGKKKANLNAMPKELQRRIAQAMALGGILAD